MHRDRLVMLTMSIRPAVCLSRMYMACNVLVGVGMVIGRGYDGQQEDGVCDVRGP